MIDDIDFLAGDKRNYIPFCNCIPISVSLVDTGQLSLRHCLFKISICFTELLYLFCLLILIVSKQESHGLTDQYLTCMM